MWNFLISSLTIGCTLVLYDGSPLRDPSLLWKYVDELGISLFGTSAKYIDHLSVRVWMLKIDLRPTCLIVLFAEKLYTERASFTEDAQAHLFNGLATRTCLVQLGVSKHQTRCAFRFHYRQELFLFAMRLSVLMGLK
jgi:hypothetical protein